MRNIRNTLLLLTVVCFFIAGCSKSDHGGKKRPPQLNPSIEDVLSKDSFEAGDVIGVFLVSYVGGSPGVLGDRTNANPWNVPYAFTGTEWLSQDDQDVFLQNVNADLYAYFPYDAQIGATDDKLNVSAYPYRIAVDQRTQSPDFLWAAARGLSNQNYQAPLVFRHVLSKLIINLNYSDDVPDDTEIMIHNTRAGAYINLGTGALTPFADDVDILPRQLDLAEEEYDFTYEVIVVPGTFAAETPLMSMVYQDFTTLFILSEDITFQSNSAYTFNIILGTLEQGGTTAAVPVSVSKVEDIL